MLPPAAGFECVAGFVKGGRFLQARCIPALSLHSPPSTPSTQPPAVFTLDRLQQLGRDEGSELRSAEVGTVVQQLRLCATSRARRQGGHTTGRRLPAAAARQPACQ